MTCSSSSPATNCSSGKSITALRSLLTELQFVDGMTGLVSLFSAREAPEPGKVPGPVFPAKLPKGEDYDKLIEQVRKNEIISGKLLSDDGTLTLVLLALDRKVVADKGLASVVQQIHDTAETELKDTGLGMKLSGAPVMQLEIRNAVERDRNLYNALGFLFGAIIAYAFFRRLSLMVIAALPPVVAIIWSLGLFGWLGFKLNLFLNVMIPLIMVLGFSNSMQLTVAMRNRLLEGDRRIKAARYAVLVVGPACVLATATAAASFIALFFSEFCADPHFRLRRRDVHGDRLRRRHHAGAAAHPHTDRAQHQAVCCQSQEPRLGHECAEAFLRLDRRDRRAAPEDRGRPRSSHGHRASAPSTPRCRRAIAWPTRCPIASRPWLPPSSSTRS